MPLICKVNQTKPTVQLASVLPATVSTATNVYSSSSGLGSQVPIDSTIDRNTKTLVINPQPSLIPQAILESHESSMDRSLPKSQISAPEKGIQIPVVISNTQNLSGLHVLASNIVFGSVNSMNSSKPAKRVVFNKGEPGMYWSPTETLELSKGFCQILIGKCAYGKPSLGVVKEFIKSRWLLKGDFSVGVLDQRH
ncbi:unnamed protein product, partial [Ilex paraguariensis]